MPVLGAVRGRFARERPLEGRLIAACLHITPETANLVRALRAGGAEVALCAANPLSTQDDVGAALVAEHGVEVLARHGEDRAAYEAHLRALVALHPQILIDDGAELIVAAHGEGDAAAGLLGATEETRTGLVRLRAMARAGT
ncbi:MAG TPA: adenosylhomocysteinase, partial [Polyangiaceae bacterium]